MSSNAPYSPMQTTFIIATLSFPILMNPTEKTGQQAYPIVLVGYSSSVESIGHQSPAHHDLVMVVRFRGKHGYISLRRTLQASAKKSIRLGLRKASATRQEYQLAEGALYDRPILCPRKLCFLKLQSWVLYLVASTLPTIFPLRPRLLLKKN